MVVIRRRAVARVDVKDWFFMVGYVVGLLVLFKIKDNCGKVRRG